MQRPLALVVVAFSITVAPITLVRIVHDSSAHARLQLLTAKKAHAWRRRRYRRRRYGGGVVVHHRYGHRYGYRHHRRRWLVPVLIGVGVLVVIGVLGGIFWSRRGGRGGGGGGGFFFFGGGCGGCGG